MKSLVRHFIVELDDQCYRLAGRKLEPIANPSEVEGDKWIVSDFEGAAPQVMTVDAPIKYVDAVIEKRLRETGALAGGNRVLVFRRRSRGSRATEAYFVSAPAALYAKYAAGAEDDDAHQLLFAAPALLSRELDSLRSNKPLAILFSHGRHVDVIVGDSRRTYGAFRASWHHSSDDRSQLIANLIDGLRSIEQKNNIRLHALHCHHWLAADEDETQWTQGLAEKLEVPRIEGRVKHVRQEGRRYSTTVPSLLAKLSIADSVSAPAQKSLYLAQVALPWAAATLVAISVLALAGSLYWSQKARTLRAESAAIEAALLPPEPAPEVLRAAYEKPLALADTLGRAQIAPSLERVLAQVSASVSPRITFEEVLIEYPDDKPTVLLTLLGRSEEPREGEGVQAFNSFLASLRQRGYTLVSSELKTDVGAFSFLVQLERGTQLKNKLAGLYGGVLAAVSLVLVGAQLLWSFWNPPRPLSLATAVDAYASERLIVDPEAVRQMNLVEPTLPKLVRPQSVTAESVVTTESTINFAMFGQRAPEAPDLPAPLRRMVAAKRPLPTYHVAMTYVSGDHRYAVIDSKLYRQNARLPGGESLAEISVGAVRLESPSGARWIQIEGPGT